MPATPVEVYIDIEGIVSGKLTSCMRLTLKAINDHLEESGIKARLEKGAGYFFFSSGEAMDWFDRVPTVSSLTLEQWVDEYLRLKKLNQRLLSGHVKSSSAVKSSSRKGTRSPSSTK